MNTLKDYLVSERKNANDKFAFGADLFAQMLKDTEQVDIPVEKIEALGRADLERNTAALKTECNSLCAACVAGAMCCEDGRQQAQSRSRRRSAHATADAQGFHRQEQCGGHSERRRSIGGRSAALQSIQRGVHQHSGTL